MKKLLFTAALLFASFGVFADEFDDFVGKMRKGADQNGVRLRADRDRRTIFFDFELPAENAGLTQARLDAMKPDMIADMKKKDRDGKFVSTVKNLRLTFVYNFTADDGRKLRLAISWREL